MKRLKLLVRPVGREYWQSQSSRFTSQHVDALADVSSIDNTVHEASNRPWPCKNSGLPLGRNGSVVRFRYSLGVHHERIGQLGEADDQ